VNFVAYVFFFISSKLLFFRWSVFVVVFG